MKRALVIGGGGYIGQRLTSRLLSENWSVASLQLPPRDQQRQLPSGDVERFYGQRKDEELLSLALATEPDVVYDLIAYQPIETRTLLNLSSGRIGRLVHLSTVSVYRTFPENGPATEQTTLRFEGTEKGYGPSKAECERVLEVAGNRGFPYVILRSGQLMGPEDPCSRQGYFVRRILNSQPILHPGFTDGFLWLLFVDDLIDGLIRAGTAPVLGRVFHLVQQNAPSLREHVEELARSIGRCTPEIRSMGVERLTDAGFRIHGFAFSRTVSVPPNTEAAQEALGWRSTPHHQAVAVTVADLLNSNRSGIYSTWPGRDTTQARLSGVHEWIHSVKEVRFLAGLTTEPGPSGEIVLSWLSDEPFGPSKPQLVESERWSSYLSDGLLPCRSTLATVPTELIVRLVKSGSKWRSSSIPQVQNLCEQALPDLVAAVELDKWTEEVAWIFTSSPPLGLPHYGLTSEPFRCRFIPLSQGLTMRPGLEESLLLVIDSVKDAETLAGFVRDCSERGFLQIDDLSSWGRLYVVGASSWLPSEVQDHFATNNDTNDCASWLWSSHVFPSTWILTHSVARLLARAGLEGAVTVKMGSVNDSGSIKLPSTTAICWVGAQTVVADPVTNRVVEISPAIAKILCGS